MIITELFGKLGLDVDESGFNAADALLGGIKAGLVGLAGMAVGGAAALAGMVVSASESAHHLDLLAQRAGVSATTLQGLAYVGGLVEMSQEDIASGLGRLTKTMAKAAEGGNDTAAAYAKFGISLKDGHGHLRNADEVLLDVADKLSDMPDGADKTAAAFKLLGKSGPEWLPLLNKGKDGITALVNEAKDMKLIAPDDATIQKNGELTETLYKIQKAMLKFPAGKLIGEANELALAFWEWLKANRALVKERIDKVVGILKAVLLGLLVVVRWTFGAVGFLVDSLKELSVILMSVVLAALVVNAGALWALVTAYAAAGWAGVGAALKTAAAWVIANAPLILTALLLFGIFLVMEDINKAMTGGKSLLKEWLGDWKDDSPGDPWWLRDFKALIYAVLHFDQVLAGLKLMWTDFWKFLEDGWDGAAKRIMRGVRKLLGMETDDDRERDTFDAAQAANARKDARLAAAENQGPGTWEADGPNGALVFHPAGGGASAGASVSQSPGNRSAVNTFQVEQNITALPGQSPQEVANSSAQQLEDWHQKQLEEANMATGQ